MLIRSEQAVACELPKWRDFSLPAARANACDSDGPAAKHVDELTPQQRAIAAYARHASPEIPNMRARSVFVKGDDTSGITIEVDGRRIVPGAEVLNIVVQNLTNQPVSVSVVDGETPSDSPEALLLPTHLRTIARVIGAELGIANHAVDVTTDASITVRVRVFPDQNGHVDGHVTVRLNNRSYTDCALALRVVNENGPRERIPVPRRGTPKVVHLRVVTSPVGSWVERRAAVTEQ